MSAPQARPRVARGLPGAHKAVGQRGSPAPSPALRFLSTPRQEAAPKEAERGASKLRQG